MEVKSLRLQLHFEGEKLIFYFKNETTLKQMREVGIFVMIFEKLGFSENLEVLS